MTTTDDLRELTRLTRLRLAQAAHLRLEQRIITAQTDRKLLESRLLLERSAVRVTAVVPPPLHQV